MVHQMSNSQLDVLIVGCGNIAGLFDQGRGKSVLPITHAGAYLKDKRFRLVACVEPDDERRMNFMSYWNIPNGFQTIGEAKKCGSVFQVISICSPTDCHADDIINSLALKPQLIFCEKPLTKSLKETKKLVEKCSKNHVQLAVNYTRRYDPSVLKLFETIKLNKLGELRSIIGCYNKGLLNNGSHMLDLLFLLLGELKLVHVGKPINDYSVKDLSVPIWLESEDGTPIHISCGNSIDYSLFELEFIFSGGILKMLDGGLFWSERRVIDSKTFKNYRVLEEGNRLQGNYLKSMSVAIDNIYNAIVNSKPLISCGKNSLYVQKLCKDIEKKLLQK
jgi:hypothetical protein